MKAIITDPEAQAELEAAADWYEMQKDGLGGEFLDGVEQTIIAIRRCPKAFPLFRNTSIRKHVMQRFPYLIFYEEFDAHLWIYAFAHSKRRPGYWLKRVEEKKTDDE